MSTYNRVFQYVKLFGHIKKDGHAQRNIENKISLALAKKEIEEKLGVGK